VLVEKYCLFVRAPDAAAAERRLLSEVHSLCFHSRPAPFLDAPLANEMLLYLRIMFFWAYE
jgi:hypothetical protein